MKLNLNFDSQNFSILGPNWSARLGCWAKVPKGPLLLDVELEDGKEKLKAQLFCSLDADNTLRHEGQWQPAP